LPEVTKAVLNKKSDEVKHEASTNVPDGGKSRAANGFSVATPRHGKALLDIVDRLTLGELSRLC